MENTPDLRGPAVVVVGSPISGYILTGPFETIDSAADWAVNHSIPGILGVSNHSIMLIQEPKYQK